MIIRSKPGASDNDLLRLSKTNKVWILYEILGIHSAYLKEGANCDFKEYYNTCIKKCSSCYNNKGQIQVKTLLELEGVFINRRTFRALQRTHTGFPIKCCTEMGIILDKLSEHVLSIPEITSILKDILNKHKNMPYDILHFQYLFLLRYLQRTESSKKTTAFKKLEKQWEMNRIMRLFD